MDYRAYKKIEDIRNSAYESADSSHCKPTAEAALLLISELCEVICEDKPMEQTRNGKGVTKMTTKEVRKRREIKLRALTQEGKIILDIGAIEFYENGDVVVNEEIPVEKLIEYTGKTDEHGKEIYEGDILKVTHLHDGHDEYWNQSCGAAIPFEVKWVGLGWEMPYDTYNFEIIGNIYETPSLLTQPPLTESKHNKNNE
jgi:hypothetical protein